MVQFASSFFRLIIVLTMFGVALAATITAVAPSVVDIATAAEFTGVDVATRSLATRSLVFDADGELIQTLQGEENRELIALDDIPAPVVTAVLAIEDAQFYNHRGVNLQATVRAAVENVGAGGISQGGSTITQQVIKNLVLTSEQTLSRKIEEASLAIQLENQTSKDDILELYLNTVYFGNGAYGVQAAAETYWGLDAGDLDWEHAALLAGMIANPSEYDPINRTARAGQQRAIVLSRLADLGHIDADEARFLTRTALPTERRSLDLVEEDYYINQVLQLLLGEATMDSYDTFALGDSALERIDAVYRGGLRIYTTYDQNAQAQALAAQAEVLPDDERGFTMAFASIDPATGAVKAIVGGSGFQEGQEYNIAVRTPGRQPGSSFKPFVLIAAMQQGYTPSDTISGIGPCNFPDPFDAEDGTYTVNNFANSGGSVDTIQNQTLRSSNCTYVRLGRIVGLDKVVEVANALGVSRKLDPVQSLPLGVEEVPPLEMAAAYATIANGGVRNDPYFIERIETADGTVLYEHRPRGARVIEAEVACWATEVLEANVERGTGTKAQIPGQPAGGKTGTTESFGDAWFVGFTPHLATAVWMGHPLGAINEMRGVEGINVTGGSFPSEAWGVFNRAYHEDLQPIDFDECPPHSSSRFVRDDGEFGSLHPCVDQTQLPVDFNGDGLADSCYAVPSDAGYQVCGLTQAVDSFGAQVPMYCADPTSYTALSLNGQIGNTIQQPIEPTPDPFATPTAIVDPTLTDPSLTDPLQPPALAPTPVPAVVISPGCNADYPYGRDEDGDGIIDRCYQFPT